MIIKFQNHSVRLRTKTSKFPSLRIFSILKYWIRVLSSDLELGTVSKSKRVAVGRTATIEAYPNQYCDFVRWSDGSTENPREVVADSDKQFTAVFKRQQGTIRQWIGY